MKKIVIKSVGLCSLVLAALILQSWVTDDDKTMTKEDGMTVVNTTIIGKSVEGYNGPTPLKIYIKKNKVVKIEAIKNHETPKYFTKVKNSLLNKWDGLKVKDARNLKVDGVTGATYSSEAVIQNVKLGLDYYQNNK